MPLGHGAAAAVHWTCVACGETGGADVVSNVVLFLPLGFALSAHGTTPWRVVLAGAGLSAAVELAQAAGIPGRDAALGDLLANTIGAALGALAGARRQRLIRPPPRVAGRLALGVSAVWLAATALSAWLVGRDAAAPGPRSPRVGLLPSVPGMGWYHGRVTRATVDGWNVTPSGAGPAIVGTAIGQHVDGTFETAGGDDRATFVPALFVHDGRGNGQLVAGQHGADAALRVRLRAARWRLRVPWLVLPGALTGVREGDTTRRTRWTAGAHGDTVRLAVTTGGHTTTTVARLTPTVAWALVLPYARVWGPERAPLTALWLAAFLAPFGYWLRWWTGHTLGGARLAPVAAGTILALGLAGVPHLFGAAAAEGWEWLCAAGALAAAYLLAGRVRSTTPLPQIAAPDSFRPCPPFCPPRTPYSASSAWSSSPPESALPPSPP